MRSSVTSKNVKWCRLILATLYSCCDVITSVHKIIIFVIVTKNEGLLKVLDSHVC